MFCAQAGKYSKPGANSKKKCENWNRSRDELYAYSKVSGLDTASIQRKIDLVEQKRNAFCESIVNADVGGVFGSRVENCRLAAKLGAQTDRLVVLGGHDRQ